MRLLLRLSLFLCFMGFVMVVPLQAQTTWTGTAPNTNFYTGSWSAGIGPGSLAIINTMSADSPVASSNSGYALDQLFVGNSTASGSMTVSNGGVINISSIYSGSDAHAGDLNVGFGIVNTMNTGLTGTLNMTGNAQVIATNGSVGNCWSTGYLNMSDTSSMSIAGALVVGGNLRADYGGINGQWSLSTGYATLGTLGNLNDSPTLTAGSYLDVGILSSTGTLTLNGRSSAVSGYDTEIGYAGTGYVVVNDEATLSSAYLNVGNAGGVGYLTINGGTVNVNQGATPPCVSA